MNIEEELIKLKKSVSHSALPDELYGSIRKKIEHDNLPVLSKEWKWKFAAAASLLLLLNISILTKLSNTSDSSQPSVNQVNNLDQPTNLKNDIYE